MTHTIYKLNAIKCSLSKYDQITINLRLPTYSTLSHEKPRTRKTIKKA